MRMISFSMTTKAFLEGRKDVTRRIGWKNLRPGERLLAVKKAMGLKKGEKIEPLGIIEVLDVDRQRLCEITADDVVREGFSSSMTPDEFVKGFCKAMGCLRDDFVTRIVFRIVSLEPTREVRATSTSQGSLFA